MTESIVSFMPSILYGRFSIPLFSHFLLLAPLCTPPVHAPHSSLATYHATHLPSLCTSVYGFTCSSTLRCLSPSCYLFTSNLSLCLLLQLVIPVYQNPSVLPPCNIKLARLVPLRAAASRPHLIGAAANYHFRVQSLI